MLTIFAVILYLPLCFSSFLDVTAVCILEGFQNQQSMLLADKVLKLLGKEKAKEKYKVNLSDLGNRGSTYVHCEGYFLSLCCLSLGIVVMATTAIRTGLYFFFLLSWAFMACPSSVRIYALSSTLPGEYWNSSLLGIATVWPIGQIQSAACFYKCSVTCCFQLPLRYNSRVEWL